MKVQQFLDNFTILKNARLDDGSVKFKFLFIKNLKNIEEEYNKVQESLQNIIQPSEKLVEFEQKRLELLRKYSEKDNDGEIKKDIRGNAIIAEDKKEEFQKEMEDLLEEYKDVIEERNKQLQEYNEILNEEFDDSNISVTKIKLDLIPDSISMKVLDAMYSFNMIEE